MLQLAAHIVVHPQGQRSAATDCCRFLQRTSQQQSPTTAGRQGLQRVAAVAEKQTYCTVCMTRCCADMLLLLREQQALAVQATFSPPCPRTELPPARTAGSNSRLRGVAAWKDLVVRQAHCHLLVESMATSCGLGHPCLGAPRGPHIPDYSPALGSVSRHTDCSQE